MPISHRKTYKSTNANGAITNYLLGLGVAGGFHLAGLSGWSTVKAGIITDTGLGLGIQVACQRATIVKRGANAVTTASVESQTDENQSWTGGTQSDNSPAPSSATPVRRM